jgi:uncharacterized protein (TIGR02646 family)
VIKITKPSQAPAILDTSGVTKRDAHCNDYLLYKAEYDTGQRKFSFDDGIYGHATVKQALIDAQHGKCCFCERKTGQDGDVEHFRPKAGCRQTAKSRLLRPGYYWLAYDWENLLLSCSACNQRHKQNLFPLTNSNQRATCHTDDTAQETSLLLHPAQQDPEQYIGFRKEIPFAINGNPTGKATIKALGLDREILNEVRRDHLDKLITLRQLVELVEQEATLSSNAEGRQLVEKAKAFLAEAVTDAGEYAAMARAAAREDFKISLP